MTTPIQPSETTFFLQEILLRPYTEGAERVNRAINGVDFHDITHREISLKNRCWSLLVGLCLMLPLINTVIWICMKTFGNPEMLSDPFVLAPMRIAPVEEIEEEEEIIEEEVEVVTEAQPIYAAPLEFHSLRCEDVSNDRTHYYEWTFETHEDMHLVKRIEVDDPSQLQARFDRDWNQKTFYMKREGLVDISIERQENTLHVIGVVEGTRVNKALKFPNKPYPWIQQPQTGFRDFLLSKQNRFPFYGVHPEKIEIVECLAIKERVHLVPYGKVIKVDYYLNQGLEAMLGPFHLSTGWYDPKSCDLLKLEYRLGLFAWGESSIIRD